MEEARYLVINTNRSGYTMLVMPFKRKTDAKKFIRTNAKKLCDEKTAECVGDYYINEGCYLKQDKSYGTTILCSPDGATICIWDIYPLKDMPKTEKEIACA